MAACRSSSVCAAEIRTRIRALPWGTPGALGLTEERPRQGEERLRKAEALVRKHEAGVRPAELRFAPAEGPFCARTNGVRSRRQGSAKPKRGSAWPNAGFPAPKRPSAERRGGSAVRRTRRQAEPRSRNVRTLGEVERRRAHAPSVCGARSQSCNTERMIAVAYTVDDLLNVAGQIEAHWQNRMPADFKVGTTNLAELQARRAAVVAAEAAVEAARAVLEGKLAAREEEMEGLLESLQNYRPAVHTAKGKSSPEYADVPKLYRRRRSAASGTGQASPGSA